MRFDEQFLICWLFDIKYYHRQAAPYSGFLILNQVGYFSLIKVICYMIELHYVPLISSENKITYSFNIFCQIGTAFLL